MFVQSLRARPSTQFRLIAHRRDDVVAALQGALRISEKGKKTGIIEVALDGPDRQKVAETLDSLARHYVRQNVNRRSADAQQQLAFIESQLPDLRAKLDKAETAIKDYQSRHGQVNLSLETEAEVSRAADTEKRLSELQLERVALRQRFTDKHPAMIALDEKIARIHAERHAVEERLRKIPDSELESARLLRDVKVATEMYMTLLNTAQQLKVVRSGMIGNVRILDTAIVPSTPSEPKTKRVLGLALLIGLALGIAAAFMRRALDAGLDDPEAIENALRLPIYASIPVSAVEDDHRRKRRRGQGTPCLASLEVKEVAIESIRSLRTSLQFALVDSKNKVVAITGPSPGVGKSFVTSNLAHLVGETGKRVLVVDGDLRRGHQHRAFGGGREGGLSEVIGGSRTLAETIRETSSPNVWLLSSGRIPPNPAELVASDRLERIMEEASERFDLVVIDTPPVLAVTDAVLVARTAGVILMIMKAGEHPMRELQAAIRSFTRNGLRVSGLVLNQVSLRRGVGRAGAYYYQYRYE